MLLQQKIHGPGKEDIVSRPRKPILLVKENKAVIRQNLTGLGETLLQEPVFRRKTVIGSFCDQTIHLRAEKTAREDKGRKDLESNYSSISQNNPLFHYPGQV
jgi:hypothetical protein